MKDLLTFLAILMVGIVLFIALSKAPECNKNYARPFVDAHTEYVCAR